MSKYESGDFTSIDHKLIKSRLIENYPDLEKEIGFKKLSKLRKFRNKIEHFAVLFTKEQVVTLVYDCCGEALNMIEKFDFLENKSEINEVYELIIGNISKLQEFTANHMKRIEPEIRNIQSKGKIIIQCPTCRQTALPLFEELKKCIFCKLSYNPENFPILWVDEIICPNPFEEPLVPILSECFECRKESLLYMDTLDLYVCLNCGDNWPTEEISVCGNCGLVSDGSNLKDDGCDQCWKFRNL